MSAATPVLFVHGLWLATAAWEPWLEKFRAAGFDPVAAPWPGESDSIAKTRSDPSAQAGFGIKDVADHFAAAAARLDSKPVVLGHSFGGLIAQNLLTRGLAEAAVAISPAQIKGVLPLPVAQLRSTFPVLGNPANRTKALSLSVGQFRYGFGNAIPESESQALHEAWMIPSPARPLFQAATANFSRRSEAAVDTKRGDRGPLLVIGAAEDHTVPAVVSRAAVKQYAGSAAVTDYRELADRGHSLTVDHGWEGVADLALQWLAAHDFPGSA